MKSICLFIIVLIWITPENRSYHRISDSFRTCSGILDSELYEVFSFGSSRKKISPVVKSVFLINDIGLIDVTTGMYTPLHDDSCRLLLQKSTTDTIMLVAKGHTLELLNIRTGYRYAKLHTDKFIDQYFRTYNTRFIPIPRDKQLQVLDLNQKKVANVLHLDRIQTDARFTAKDFLLFSKSERTIFKLNGANGSLDSITNYSGLVSNVLYENRRLIFADSSGLRSFDEFGRLIWSFSNTGIGSRIALWKEVVIATLDSKLAGIDLTSGRVIWISDDNSVLLHPDNFLVTTKGILASIYYDSDAVIALFDPNSGKIICDGSSMPNDMGYSRYTFLTADDTGVYAIDEGGDPYRIVKLRFKKEN